MTNDGLMEPTGNAQLIIHAGRCLNGRSQSVQCRACVDGCPRRAIVVDDEHISFDTERCSQCALCVIDCPAEVFAHDGFAPLDFLRSVQGQRELKLYCPQAGHVAAGSDAIGIPCHGLLDDRLLLGLRAIGVERILAFGLNRCGDCPTEAGHRRLTHTLEASAPSLATGFPAVLDADGTSAPPDAGRAGMETPMDRRRFLGASVNTVARVTLDILADEVLRTDASTRIAAANQTGGSAKHLPQRHRLALSNLRAGAISATDFEEKWFHEVRLGGECHACANCAQICPTGSLFMEQSGTTAGLVHRPAHCIGCGLCIEACPQKALTLSAATNLDRLADEGYDVLFTCTLATCRSCGAAFTDADGSGDVCLACINERLIRSQWLGL